jgi:hypothetical protein
MAMKEERAQEVRAAFRDRFSVAKNAEWMSSYLAAVKQAQAVSEGHFGRQIFNAASGRLMVWPALVPAVRSL